MLHETLIPKYYPQDNELRRLLLRHSRQVAERAVAIIDRHPELGADRHFVYEAAMLHDIGIFLTHAPRIHCHGQAAYLQHGWLGAELMRREGFPDFARVCERHTGTGLTRQQIEEQQLALPLQDFLPETIEEIIVCYADKFYSKSHIDRECTVEQAAQSLLRFGEEGVEKFLGWAAMFE
ncbi:HDIG domain-containing protein [Alloprevotella sp. OH1205_COT-284]|uniref:HDIG domain-containing metalloprotein n=1 Tax=Alloprevotella sp. OH1205_COT-284 TaxID=2491043 RepID=UPI000F5E5D98|nr:HDIG domain-containing metalloprotein [Alloprevotella sp. OH1205_COT-284]RRD80204.1 HDIG domain-containing protein [Alloprevotella sp. OH1205_COT-284]